MNNVTRLLIEFIDSLDVETQYQLGEMNQIHFIVAVLELVDVNTQDKISDDVLDIEWRQIWNTKT